MVDFRVTADKEEAQKILNECMDNYVERDRMIKIREKYGKKYEIKDDLTTISEIEVNIDYLPTVDFLLKAKKRYKKPEEVVGAAFFKIEKDDCIFLTDSKDKNLQRVYNSHRKSADRLAKELTKLNTMEFEYSTVNQVAAVLNTSFYVVFGKTFGNWKRSLENTKAKI